MIILIAGRFLGSAGISGINNSSQVLGIVNTVVIGLSMGGTILIGRLFGQGEKSKMQNASNTFINSFFIMGIIMSVVLYFVSPMIITLMKTPAYNEAVSYFKVCAIGVFFTFCYNALSGVMRAVGNSKMPMYCIFVSTTVNIVLDIIFMGVIKLGTAGAALATVIAQGISFFMALGFVLKQKDMWTSLKIYGNVLGKIIKIGFPCAVQMTVAGISFIVVTYTINTYGVAASAGSAISMKLRDIPFLVVSTMSNAASAMIAQNLGAGLYERSEKNNVYGNGYDSWHYISAYNYNGNFCTVSCGLFYGGYRGDILCGIKYPNRSYRSAFLQCVYDTTFPCHRSRSYFCLCYAILLLIALFSDWC